MTGQTLSQTSNTVRRMRIPRFGKYRRPVNVFVGLAVAAFLLWVAVAYTGPFLAAHSRDHLNDSASAIAADIEARFVVALQDLGATTQYIAAVPDHDTSGFQGFVSGIKEAGLCARSISFIATAELRDGRFVLDSVAPPRLQAELNGRQASDFGVLDEVIRQGERSTTDIVQVDLSGMSERLIAFYEPVPGSGGSRITIAAHRVDELIRDVVESSISAIDGPVDPLLITLHSSESPIHILEVNGTIGQSRDGLTAAQNNSVQLPGYEWELQVQASKRYGITAVDLLLSRVSVVVGFALVALVAVAAVRWRRSMSRIADKVDRAEAEADIASSDLALTNRQVAAVLESAQDGILLVDNHRRILWANPALLRLFNVPAQDWEGKPSKELMAYAKKHVPNGQEFQGRVDSIYGDHRLTISNEEIQLTTSPTKFLARSSSPIVDESDAPTGRLWIYRDLTREHEARQARESFVSTVSHELRTPLTAMRSSMELLTDGLAGPLSDRQASIASDALVSSIRLSRLVEDVLSFSHSSSGAVSLERLPFDFATLLDEVVAAVKSRHPDSAHELQIYVPTELPPMNADSQRMFQVLTNLLDNAFGYTPSGGSIRVAVNTEGDRFSISISDNGVGIPQDHIEAIWKPFRRAPVSISRPSGSTGLGLSVARSIIEAHGGAISVASQPGVGSTFTVTL